MLLYILRHGKAEPGHPGEPDSTRRLTQEGKQQSQRVLARAAAAGIKPQAVLASPYIRARETAEIAREILGISGAVLPCKALLPDSRLEALWDEVRLHEQDALMLVGHNPLLGEFLTLLLAAGNHAIDLKTAGLACVDVGSPSAHPRGRLLWLLTPEVSG
jgi:phosphohistidine phosphatase